MKINIFAFGTVLAIFGAVLTMATKEVKAEDANPSVTPVATEAPASTVAPTGAPASTMEPDKEAVLGAAFTTSDGTVVKLPSEFPIDESLSPVKNVKCKAVASLTAVNISWDKVENAVSYLVFKRVAKDEYKLAKTIAGNFDKETGLSAGYTPVFVVCAKVPKSEGGYVLTPISADASATLIPAKPKKFKAKASRGKNTLTWKKMKKGTVSGYEVWCKVSVKIKGVKLSYMKLKDIKSYKITKLKHKMLVRGMTYNYKLRAYKKVRGKKIYSKFVSIKKKAK